MYEYAVITGVTPANYNEVCAKYQKDNYELEQSNHYRIPAASHRSLGSAQAESRWDLVFKRAGKDISYSQLLINRYSDKLREVANKLLASQGLSGIEAASLGRNIKEFMFKGSPEDM